MSLEKLHPVELHILNLEAYHKDHTGGFLGSVEDTHLVQLVKAVHKFGYNFHVEGPVWMSPPRTMIHRDTEWMSPCLLAPPSLRKWTMEHIGHREGHSSQSLVAHKGDIVWNSGDHHVQRREILPLVPFLWYNWFDTQHSGPDTYFLWGSPKLQYRGSHWRNQSLEFDIPHVENRYNDLEADEPRIPRILDLLGDQLLPSQLGCNSIPL